MLVLLLGDVIMDIGIFGGYWKLLRDFEEYRIIVGEIRSWVGLFLGLFEYESGFREGIGFFGRY